MSIPNPMTAAQSATNGAARMFYAVRRSLIAYARWLDSITWKRFFLLALLAIIVTGILSELPPFTIPWGHDRTELRPPRVPAPPSVGKKDGAKKEGVHIEGVNRDGKTFEI